MGTATPRDFDTVNDVYLISEKGDSEKIFRVTSVNWNTEPSGHQFGCSTTELQEASGN